MSQGQHHDGKKALELAVLGVTGGSVTAAQILAGLDVTAGTGVASKGMQLDSSGNFAMPVTGMFGLSRIAVAALGADAAGAAPLTAQVNLVTAADGAKGVALPTASATGGPILVINTVATADLLVYPVSGGDDTINGQAEDIHVLLRPGRAAWFVPTSATAWNVDPSALSFNSGELGTGPGVGITGGSGTVCKTSVTRAGGIITTSFLIDLTGLNGGGTGDDVIGVNGAGAASIGRIVAEQCGTVFGGRMTCLETPATGNVDVDVWAANESTGVEDTAISALTGEVQLIDHGNWAAGEVAGMIVPPGAGQYLYLTNGAATSATYTAGQFLLEFFGYDA